MTDNFIRHLVSIAGTLIGALIYFAGYVGGQHGWWWAGAGVLSIYLIVHKMITAGGGGHH